MTIHRIYGLRRAVPACPDYMDVKHLNETARTWRRRVQDLVSDYRGLHARLEKSRDLLERHYLEIEARMAKSHVYMGWHIYRAVMRDASEVSGLYISNIRRPEARKYG